MNEQKDEQNGVSIRLMGNGSGLEVKGTTKPLLSVHIFVTSMEAGVAEGSIKA